MRRGTHGNHARGSAHPRWNHGQLKSSHGYVKVRVGKDHPLADPNGYAYEHLVVWMSAGRPMPQPDEIIHHRDEDKANNRLTNLQLKKRSDHNAEHNSERYGRHKAITIDDARTIIRRREQGEQLKAIAADYGVLPQAISRIAKGQRWKSARNIEVIANGR
jgi:hypothetical protein